MFLRYLDFIFVPFRNARAKWVQAKNVKGNIKVDVNRAKNYKNVAGRHVSKGKEMAGVAKQHAAEQQKIQGQVAGNAPAMPAGQGQQMTANPGIIKKGFLFKKHFCGQCGQRLEKSWDQCPYCAQAPAPNKKHTIALNVDAAGSQGHTQLLGWLVPLSGDQRGELYTLSPVSSVGTDPACTVVLSDGFMSSQHAEIRVDNGRWVLKDLGSTNGTFVNDQRVDQRELVDNDVIKFGQSPTKFKQI